MKLDLACGSTKRDGWIGLDCVHVEGVDVVHNLNVYPWPFLDGEVDEVLCRHYIEHIPLDTPRGDGLIVFMNELHRILRIGGVATIVCPYWSSIGAWQDPTHRRAISENTFAYFNAKWRADAQLAHYPITADFECDVELSVVNGRTQEDIEERLNMVHELTARLVKR